MLPFANRQIVEALNDGCQNACSLSVGLLTPSKVRCGGRWRGRGRQVYITSPNRTHPTFGSPSPFAPSRPVPVTTCRCIYHKSSSFIAIVIFPRHLCIIICCHVLPCSNIMTEFLMRRIRSSYWLQTKREMAVLAPDQARDGGDGGDVSHGRRSATARTKG